MQIRRIPGSWLIAAALAAVPLWALSAQERSKPGASLEGRISALEQQVETLQRELAVQRAAVRVAGADVVIAATGTLHLRGTKVQLNGGSKPVVGGPLSLPAGRPIGTTTTREGRLPCIADGVSLASGSPTVFVP